MRIRLEHNGIVFEYERHPLPAARFRAICALAGAVMYVGMVTAVTALCGVPGLLLTVGGTVLVGMVIAGFM